MRRIAPSLRKSITLAIAAFLTAQVAAARLLVNSASMASLVGAVARHSLPRGMDRPSVRLQNRVSPSESGGGPFQIHGPVESRPEDLFRAVASSREAPDKEVIEHQLSAKNGRGSFDSKSRSKRTAARSVPISLASLPQTPAPTTSWEAKGANVGFIPADAQIAASRTHVIVTAIGRVSYYDKSGAVLGGTSVADLFQPLQPYADGGKEIESPITRYGDLRAIFDSYRNRFWVAASAATPADFLKKDASKYRSILAVAVSKTENPLDGWRRYWWYQVAHWGQKDNVYQKGDTSDYPSLGIDPTSFHETNSVDRYLVPGDNGFDSDNPKKDYRYWHVAFVPADKLASGLASSGWEYWDLKNPDGKPTSIIQPVVHHGDTGRAYYASRYGSDQVLVWALTDAFKPTQMLDVVAVQLVDDNGVGVPFAKPPNAPQKGASTKIKMDNLGTNVMKAVYRGGFLIFVTHDAVDWFADGQLLSSIRLVRLFVLGFPNVTTLGDPSYTNRIFGKNNSIDDQPDDRNYYCWAAVEANKNIDMVAVYARSGVTLYPEVRYSAYFSSEPDIRPSRLLKAGEATYGDPNCVEEKPRSRIPCAFRWGDTAGASVDPFDDTSIWIAQQYSNASGKYGVWVGKVFGERHPDVFIDPGTLSFPSEAAPQQEIEVSGTIGNQGDGSVGPVRIEVYLSRDCEQGVRIGEFTQLATNPSERTLFTVTGLIPADSLDGDYRIKVVVTPTDDVVEYSRDNNTACSDRTILIRSSR